MTVNISKQGGRILPRSTSGPSVYKPAIAQRLYSGMQWHPVELKILIIIKKKKEYLSSE